MKENEDLLIKDLYGRLLYGVECKDIYANVSGKLDEISTRYNMCRLSDVYGELETCYIPNCRPYLFPLSSMTEEERNEYKHFVAFSGNPTGTANFIDWLNAHHFDYRGLIPMGIALDATGKNIY